jgi:hypothetical protein
MCFIVGQELVYLNALLKSSGFNVIFVGQLCDILSLHWDICDIIVLNKLTWTQSKHISDERKKIGEEDI